MAQDGHDDLQSGAFGLGCLYNYGGNNEYGNVRSSTRPLQTAEHVGTSDHESLASIVAMAYRPNQAKSCEEQKDIACDSLHRFQTAVQLAHQHGLMRYWRM